MSTQSDNTWRYNASFPSIFGAGDAFVDAVLQELERRAWSPKDSFAVRLALEEAIANAVEHGNRRNPSKQVDVFAEISLERVLLSVRDEGEGFDEAATPNPTLDENLEIPTGRGLFLIRSFMTNVWRGSNGAEIFMEKTPTPNDA
ncbi:MAG: ATP-binding protein [Thermoguttaceae bacterium]|nr:ATP-binding protein [Thermoguttaceae bacterium]MBQ7028641.1 ATP-binding protein [Thermoguttaceae bacterium]MBQ7112262.1 ATP-binding protein [Thermoguttaceae bacterium]